MQSEGIPGGICIHRCEVCVSVHVYGGGGSLINSSTKFNNFVLYRTRVRIAQDRMHSIISPRKVHHKQCIKADKLK